MAEKRQRKTRTPQNVVVPSKTRPAPKRVSVTNIIDPNVISPQMLAFVDHYIVTLNGTEAARLANYQGSDEVLASTASRLLRNEKVIAEISRRLERFAMSANEVLVRLTDIARADIADALSPQGAIDPLEAKRRGKSHLIKRFKTKEVTADDKVTYETEIELHDSLKALELLAKYHDLVNRVKIDDWRSQAIADIRSGRINFDALAQAFDESLAKELFLLAGVPVE